MQRKVTTFLLYSFEIACLLLSIFLLYMINTKIPFQMDDNWYATNLVTGLPLSSLQDIWESQLWHFTNWGGRTIAHTLLQLILWAGPFWADCSNVLFTFLLILLICKLAGSIKLNHILMIFGILFVFNTDWYQTLLWQSGIANYLYTTTIIFFYLSFYVTRYDTESDFLEKSPWKRFGLALLMIPLGLMAGWSNENMGPSILIGTCIIMISIWKKEHRIIPWMLVGSLSCLLGNFLLITAPGNAVRSLQATADDATKGLLWRCFLRGFSMANGLFIYLLYTILFFLILWGIHHFLLEYHLRKTDRLFLCMAFLSYGAMILSPHYPNRAAFGTIALLLVPSLHMFAEIEESKKNMLIPSHYICIFLWLGGMFPICTYLSQTLGWI